VKAETEAWLRSPLSYDGLLISTSALHHVPPGTLPEGYPVVALGESMEDPAVDHVAIDNDAGLELATRHLLEFGRRRVAFVGGSLDGGTGMVVQRIRGYVRALVAAGMEVDDALVVPTSRGLDGGRAAAAMILSAGADGAVRVTDTVALGLLRGLADAGVLVPDEVPVVGFDNIQPASYAVPSLTTIDPRVGELVETAVGMLLERMRGFDGAGRLHVGRCVLVRRESTAL
jgi:DNA-binding LacI/PurR family transcriptional regulator